MEDEEEKFRTEYAKSSRSSCRLCKSTITQDSLRMAIMVASPKFDGKIPHWYHFSCFFKKTRLKSVSQVSGMGGLRWEDQEKIKARINGAESTDSGVGSSKGKAGKGKKGDGPPAKKMKVETVEEKALREQNELIWKARDQLQQNINTAGLKLMLETNGQNLPPGESRLLDRCADGMVFGALEPCAVCSGQLVARTHYYQCTGNISGWTKCVETTKVAKRSPWIIPDDLKEEFDFLAKYKYKPRERVFPEAEESVDGPSQSKPSQPPVDPDKPLSGFSIMLVGRLSQTRPEMTAEIKQLGGKVVTTASASTTICISNKMELDKGTKKMAEVEENGVPVVDEKFLEDAAQGNALGKIAQHTISSWATSHQSLVPAQKTPIPVKKSVYELVPAKMKMVVKGGVGVDPDSDLSDTHHVLEYPKGTVHNAVLGMVDIVRGSNSYYKLQLLEADRGGGGRYELFRSWGRVGTTIGGNKLESFGNDRESAIEDFERLYWEKTLNRWEERNNFVKKPGKFYPLEIDYGGQEDDSVGVAKPIVSADSKLAPAVQELVRMIFDIDAMKKTMMEFEIDMKKMPLGRLSRRQIQQAYSVLSELQSELSGAAATSSTRVLDASNRFYTLIPHDFGMQKPPLLNSLDIITAKTQMLDNLMEIELAYNLLKQGDGGGSSIDAHYEKLNTTLEVLSNESEEYRILSEYVTNTHAVTHNQYSLEILEAFTTSRKGESKRYKPFSKLHNRMLLWHGSRVTNFAGILSQGLRIAPPEAPVTGYMFGKGVYFADMVSKSANYCHTSRDEPVGLLLLCEVALGDMYERTSAEYVTKLPSSKHSTKGVGRTMPDPACTYTSSTGALIPAGKGIPSSSKKTSLLYNEYIVYDVAQINVKYLLKTKFNFKY